MDVPASLARGISPPRPLKRRRTSGLSPEVSNTPPSSIEPTLAAIEAGKAKIDDHLAYFKTRLAKACRQTQPDIARMSMDDFSALYRNNLHEHGNHFVVHQHNHPRAGVHYDLRLQFSETSSMSFALPKGLPGDPNSKSIGRMAIETRIHNFWTHLIESASKKTGSLLIWDTGIYEVLPRITVKGRNRRGIPSPQTTDDEDGESNSFDEETPAILESKMEPPHENDKLITAFQTRYIRLRLHGTRLPNNYTVILRLPTNEIIKRPTASRKNRRKHANHQTSNQPDSDTDTIPQQDQDEQENLDTDTDEDVQTRLTNAYPGSTNTVNSVHQRHWFLQLDRQSSGFVLDQSGKWICAVEKEFEPFYVRGRDHERSVVTGRLAREVEEDEGVVGFVGRGGWVGVDR